MPRSVFGTRTFWHLLTISLLSCGWTVGCANSPSKAPSKAALPQEKLLPGQGSLTRPVWWERFCTGTSPGQPIVHACGHADGTDPRADQVAKVRERAVLNAFSPTGAISLAMGVSLKALVEDTIKEYERKSSQGRQSKLLITDKYVELKTSNMTRLMTQGHIADIELSHISDDIVTQYMDEQRVNVFVHLSVPRSAIVKAREEIRANLLKEIEQDLKNYQEPLEDILDKLQPVLNRYLGTQGFMDGEQLAHLAGRIVSEGDAGQFVRRMEDLLGKKGEIYYYFIIAPNENLGSESVQVPYILFEQEDTGKIGVSYREDGQILNLLWEGVFAVRR